METVSFDEVRRFLESHGWQLMRRKNPYWIFERPRHQLPMPVKSEGATVAREDFDRLKEVVFEIEREQG